MSAVALSGIGQVLLVGAGKMGLAMARSWLAAGLPPENLTLVDPAPAPETQRFAEAHAVGLAAAPPAGARANVIVIAVKPQIIDSVLAGLRDAVGPETLVVSVAAGISLSRLAAGLGTGRVVRTMPNTPAQIGKGITGAVAGPEVPPEGRAIASALMEATGGLVWFEAESDLDAVTAVSGSGPAYVFHLVEALAEAGRRQGLAPDIAMTLARKTVIGAAALMEADPAEARTLRENVTSPNGTTAAALAILMEDEALTGLMDRAVTAARRRSEELGRG